MITANATGGSIENIGYDSNLGDTRIVPSNNGKYATTMLGNTKQLTEKEATDLTSLIYTLDNIKSQYQAGIFNNDINRIQQLANSLKVISNNVSTIINKNPMDVEMMIGNYILTP